MAKKSDPDLFFQSNDRIAQSVSIPTAIFAGIVLCPVSSGTSKPIIAPFYLTIPLISYRAKIGRTALVFQWSTITILRFVIPLLFCEGPYG